MLFLTGIITYEFGQIMTNSHAAPALGDYWREIAGLSLAVWLSDEDRCASDQENGQDRQPATGNGSTAG